MEANKGRTERSTTVGETTEETNIASPVLNGKVEEGNIFGIFFSSLARGSPASAVRSLQRNDALPVKEIQDHLSTSENLCCSWDDFSVVLDATEMRRNEEEPQKEEEGKTERKKDTGKKTSTRRGKNRRREKKWRSTRKGTDQHALYPTAKRETPHVGLPTLLSVERCTTSLEKGKNPSMNEKEMEEVKGKDADHRPQLSPPTRSTPARSWLPSSKHNERPEEGNVRRERTHSSTTYDISPISSSCEDASVTFQSTSTFSSRSLPEEPREKKPRRDELRSPSMSGGRDSPNPMCSLPSSPCSISSFSFTPSSRVSFSSSRYSFSSVFSSSCSTCSGSSLPSGKLDRCIPLKEGCRYPLPSRYFVDFAFRLSHPQSLLPYSEEGHIYEWDLQKGEWHRTLTRVVLSVEPFAHGNMRSSYYLIDLNRPLCRLTAKRYVRHPAPREQYFDDVSMHSVAGHWARLYNSLLPPKLVKFIPAAVLELPHRRPRLTLAMEPLLNGTFDKYNNNCGFLPKKIRWTPQAFSHFTYVYSHQQLMVVDIQGVSDIYTDPQILSPDGEGYGMGNLGMKGIQRFFHSHVCNPICHQLGLSQHFPVGVHERQFPLLPYGPLHPQRANQREGSPKSGGIILPAQGHDALSQHLRQTSAPNFLFHSVENPKSNNFFVGGKKDIDGPSCRARQGVSSHGPIAAAPVVSTPLIEYPSTMVEVAAIFSENLPPKASNLHLNSSASSAKNVSSTSRSAEHCPSFSSVSDSAHTKGENRSAGGGVHLPHSPVGCKSECRSMHLEPGPPKQPEEGRRKEPLIPRPPGAFIRPTPPASSHSSHCGVVVRPPGKHNESGGGVLYQTNGGAEKVKSASRYASHSPCSPVEFRAQHYIRNNYCTEDPLKKNVVIEKSEDGLPKNEEYARRLRQYLVRQGHTLADGNNVVEVSLGSCSSRYNRSVVGHDTKGERSSPLSSSEAKNSWQWNRHKPLVQGTQIVSEVENEVEEKGVLSSERSSHHKISKEGRSRALVATERVPPSR